MKKRKVLDAERSAGTSIEKIAGKEYERVVTEKMGADGVPETHMTFVSGRGGKRRILYGNVVCKNVMSDADRKRLGIE